MAGAHALELPVEHAEGVAAQGLDGRVGAAAALRGAVLLDGVVHERAGLGDGDLGLLGGGQPHRLEGDEIDVRQVRDRRVEVAREGQVDHRERAPSALAQLLQALGADLALATGGADDHVRLGDGAGHGLAAEREGPAAAVRDELLRAA